MALSNKIASFYVEDPENADMLEWLSAEDAALLRKRERTEFLKQQHDIMLGDPQFLWEKLKEKGWTLHLELSEQQRRDLLLYVTTVLKGRGWVQSIADTIYLLFGLELFFLLLDTKALDYWIIGFSKLGINTRIGERDFRAKVLISLGDQDVDDETRAKIVLICEFLRPATKWFVYDWLLPPRYPFPSPGWFIARSRIGIDADIAI